MSSFRYVYLGDALTDTRWKNQPCDPVRRPDGKCVVGKGKALVVFADGTRVYVLRRRLRLTRPNPETSGIVLGEAPHDSS